MSFNDLPAIGSRAPMFSARTDSNDRYAFGSLGGRWVLLVFFGSLGDPAAQAAHRAVMARRPSFDDSHASYFGVSTDPADRSQRGLKAMPPGVRYFYDDDLRISRQYGVADDQGGQRPVALLLDRALRVVMREPLEGVPAILDAMDRLIDADVNERALQRAPVLTVPRVFEPELCQTLIDYYQREERGQSGVMREVNGMTVGVLDDRFKKRRDAPIHDAELLTLARDRISNRLIPEIQRAFNWRGTRIERYMVACYTAAEGGFFSPHRDNTTAGTAHRVFAVSLNLNSNYHGGELVFPEYGQETYKPPAGGATVFSCSMLHAATPVIIGERYVFVPFLYDENGYRIREANSHKLKSIDRNGYENAPAKAPEPQPAE